jgi:hypothetical protein
VLTPPAIKTFALLSNVAVCEERGVSISPADLNRETATPIEFDVPVIAGVTVSVAVMVSLPAVLSVTEKFALPVPVDSIELAGSTAWPSVLVMCTVPV